MPNKLLDNEQETNLDIDKLKALYQQGGGADSVYKSLSGRDQALQSFVTRRIAPMMYRKYIFHNRWKTLDDFKYIFLNQLDNGEDYNAPLRLNGAFGTCQRLYSEFMEAIPKSSIKCASKDEKARMKAFAIEQAVQFVKDDSNYYIQHAKCIENVVDKGNGIKEIGYVYNDRDAAFRLKDGQFDDVASMVTEKIFTENVDPRFFYMDEANFPLHDEVRHMQSRDCVRDHIIAYSTFKMLYGNNPKYRNTEFVRGVSKNTTFYTCTFIPYMEENAENNWMSSNGYVHLYKYYNQEQDLFIICANGVPIFDSRLEDNHKMVPFVHYKMYNNNSSQWGNGALEVIYNILVTGDINNTLALDSMRFALQRVGYVDGDVSFNPDAQKMEPGAIFRIHNLDNRKIQDVIHWQDVPNITADYFNMKKILDDAKTVAIGDDEQGLYANPDQLATQTAYKENILKKRLKSVVQFQEFEAVKYETKMIVELMKQYLMQDKKTSNKGAKQGLLVEVKGYDIQQNDHGNDNIPQFVKMANKTSVFEVTKDMFDLNYRVVIADNISAQEDSEQTLNSTMQFVQMLMQSMQVMPSLAEKVDIFSALRVVAEKLNLDTMELFPDLYKNSKTEVDNAIFDIVSNVEPKPLQNPTPDIIMMLLSEKNRPMYQDFKAGQKRMFDKYIVDALGAIKAAGQQEDQVQMPLQPQAVNPNANVSSPQLAQSAPSDSGVANSSTAKTIGSPLNV